MCKVVRAIVYLKYLNLSMRTPYTANCLVKGTLNLMGVVQLIGWND